MAEWSVGRITPRCCVSGRMFSPGETIMAAIYEQPKAEGFLRRDFSMDAFARTGGRIDLDGQPLAPFSFWQTNTRDRTESPRQTLVDDAVLVDFFERLADAPELLRQQFRYVLALILMRKRLLRLDSQRVAADGLEHLNMTLFHPVRKANGARARIPCELVRPPITEQEIPQVAGQLGAILAGDEQALL